MSSASKIEWTEATWNPTTGCDHVSPGCDNCYAERMAKRLAGRAGYPADEPFRLTLHEDRIDQPLKWRKPRLVFVNSMSDLFHPDVPAVFIGRVFNVMGLASQHTFQVLTKRPQRAAKVLRYYTDTFLGGVPLPNVWIGTSIENDTYTFRANHLRSTPAAVRFLSCEPLLGPLPSLDLAGIDWVIVGGESGPGARPMRPDWAQEIRDRCVKAEVAFFFKQWGAWAPQTERLSRPLVVDGDFCAGEFEEVDALVLRRVGKKAAGRVLDGRTWDEMPEHAA